MCVPASSLLVLSSSEGLCWVFTSCTVIRWSAGLAGLRTRVGWWGSIGGVWGGHEATGRRENGTAGRVTCATPKYKLSQTPWARWEPGGKYIHKHLDPPSLIISGQPGCCRAHKCKHTQPPDSQKHRKTYPHNHAHTHILYLDTVCILVGLTKWIQYYTH